MTQAFNLALLANNVNSSGQLNAATGLYNPPIPSGTAMLFYQASAPTGWTQNTSLDDYALRLTSGTGGSTGGTTAFSTVFANQTPTISGSVSGTTGATTLSTTQIPSHTHSINLPPRGGDSGGNNNFFSGVESGTQSFTSDSTGGGGSHTHSFSGSITGFSASAITLNVRYANIIICTKN